jgi:hypothetical protein
MAQFINLFPESEQADVTRTTVIRFTVLSDSYGVNINSLNMFINNEQVISFGSFINGYNGNKYPSAGKYVVGVFPKKPNFLPYAANIKITLNVLDAYDTLVSNVYHFYTDGYNPPPIPPIPPHPDGRRACLKCTPEFYPTRVGLKWAHDKGTGTQVDMQWEPAVPYNQDDIVFYNVYYSTVREGLFDGYPEFIIDGLTASVGGLPPGDSHYFGIRAAEVNPIIFTLDGLKQAGEDMYFYPLSSLSTNITSSSVFIPVDSVDGFAERGILHIDEELIKYTSVQISPPGFNIPTGGRGFYATIARSHSSGIYVRMYQGTEDNNTVISTATPTFQKPNYALVWELGDGYGDDGYRDGYDGYAFHDGYLRYRQEKYDSITTDGYSNDQTGTFPRFDYCGSWRALAPYNYMQGQCIGSYFGGAQVRYDKDGYRHLVKTSNVQTHLEQREELLLETTGEPMVLIRRQWTGIRCLCIMSRSQHPDSKCPICFGTGFVSGYQQFFNPRRMDRRILVRVDPTTDDLAIIDSGLQPMYEPSAWTLSFPAIKDRDILIRFNTDMHEEFRYEILNVTRNRTMFSQVGAQKFVMKRFPKTDVMYQFPVERTFSQYPASIYTSTISAPGIVAHSHGVIIPSNIVNYSNLSVATLESQGHNHIIIKGRVYEVLGHTHTLPLL